MRLIVVLCILLLSFASQPADAQHILWHPFDFNNGSPDCGFGCYEGHEGSDWSCDVGTPIYASISGTVIDVTNNVPGQTCTWSFGNKVTIENDAHDIRVITAHMLQNSFVVSVNSTVTAGQFIGRSSNTGYTLTQDQNGNWVCESGGGEHLHLEIRVKINGTWTAVNPYSYNGGMWTNPLQLGNQVTFACTYKDQTAKGASGYYDLHPGDVTTFWVEYYNSSSTSSPAWSNTNGNGNYVELKSCDTNGGTPHSGWLYNSSDWINASRVTTMNQSSVSPPSGQTQYVARFEFLVKVPDDASIGVHSDNHFRIIHATGGAISDWAGVNFPINVIPLYRVKFDFDGDGIADYWDRTSTGLWHLDYASNNLTSWDWTGYGYGGSQDTPCPADYDGDGKCDMAVLWNSDRTFRIDYASNGFGGFDATYSGYGGWTDYPCPADYDGDHKDDIAVRDSSRHWYIDYASNGFGSWDETSLTGYGGNYDRPCPADYDGDGKADLAILRDSDRKYFIDYYANGYTGWDETNLGGYGGFADYPCPADYNGDGKDDIAVLNTTDHYWRVDHTGNGFGSWDYVLGGYGGTGDRPCPGDYAGDGWVDIACYHASISQFCIDYGSSQQNYGSWDWCDAGADHPTAKVVSEETLPLEFSLSQNYPNPFNPTTTISYSLPKASHVTLTVYNVLGQKMHKLVDEDQAAGEHSVNWNADHTTSGIYFYRLEAADRIESRKMLLLK